MRTIPNHINDPQAKARLEKIAKEIDAKMKQVEVLKQKMKSGKMETADLTSLKEIGTAIDTLDKEWKSLIA